MKPRIWLSSPHMGGQEQQYIREAFDNNWIAPLGPNVDGFEKDLVHYTGVQHAAALSSGTAAIHLALILLDIKPGDVVLCQSFTFSATANPIIYQGGIPVFIDSEPETWNMDPVALETAIIATLEGRLHEYNKGKTSHTSIAPQKPKAILPVHLYGMPAKMAEITAIADKYDIPVIEDAAEALGSRIESKACGSFGKFGILSFNGNKIITTSGGGALLSDDEEAINKARFLATQARDKAPHYQHSHIGYNYRMSNIVAGIGRGQMQVLDERIYLRRANFSIYKKHFEEINLRGYNISLLNESQGYLSNRWLTTIVINPEQNQGINREKLRLAFESENIECRPLWKPMHMQPVFSSYPFIETGTSESLFETGLCLPSGSNQTKDDFERIFGVTGSIFR